MADEYSGLTPYSWAWESTTPGGDDPDEADELDDTPAKLNVSSEWDPLKVLASVFGDKAHAAYGVCRRWAFRGDRVDQVVLREAVSVACEWAVLRHHGYTSYEAYKDADRVVLMRHGQSVSVKPGNYVRESLRNALREAARKAGPDRWKYGRVGERCTECNGKGKVDSIPCDFCDGTGKLKKRKWIHAYRVELVRGYETDDPEPSEPVTPLNDPNFRPAYRAPDYSGPGEVDPDAQARAALATLVSEYLATQDARKVRAFEAMYMSAETGNGANSQRALADELGVKQPTIKRWADEIRAPLTRLFMP